MGTSSIFQSMRLTLSPASDSRTSRGRRRGGRVTSQEKPRTGQLMLTLRADVAVAGAAVSNRMNPAGAPVRPRRGGPAATVVIRAPAQRRRRPVHGFGRGQLDDTTSLGPTLLALTAAPVPSTTLSMPPEPLRNTVSKSFM